MAAERTAKLTTVNAQLQQEIVERRQVETALRENEARYRELFDTMTSGVAVYEAVDDGQGQREDELEAGAPTTLTADIDPTPQGLDDLAHGLGGRVPVLAPALVAGRRGRLFPAATGKKRLFNVADRRFAALRKHDADRRRSCGGGAMKRSVVEGLLSQRRLILTLAALLAHVYPRRTWSAERLLAVIEEGLRTALRDLAAKLRVTAFKAVFDRR